MAGIAGCLLLVAAVYFFDWNLARPYIAGKVTTATGRSFAINGDLQVHLGLRPRIVASGVAIGNAAWSKDPVMAEIERAEFTVDLLQLLAGRLALPELLLSGPRLHLELNRAGTPNWVFDQRDQQRELPVVGALAIDRGTLSYRDPTANTDLTLDINTVDTVKDGSGPAVEFVGRGRFKGLASTLQARGGALLALRDAERPYPIKAAVTLGTTKASFDGTLVDPLHLRGEEVNFHLEGSDLALLYPVIGVPIPPTPAYKLSGFLSHTGHLWTFRRLKGTVGKSDLAGEFSVDHGKSPQFIKADLVSRSLDLKDLGGFIGVERADTPVDHPPPGERMLPARQVNLEKLRAANFDVRFRGAHVIAQSVPIENMDAYLLVKDATLKLVPLNFGIAGGNLVTEIAMDARKSQVVTHADITAKGLHLDQLFPKSALNALSAGTLGGRAKLDGTGNSMAQMLGTANGEAALIMDGGTVSELLLRESNLDVANSIRLLLGGDKQVPVRCMVADFKAVAGEFRTQDLVLDTSKVVITGEGTVNFGDESLHLRLASQSKGFSLISLRGPVLVTGSFKNPKVHPELGNAVMRGGLAVVLGALTAGVGTLIPLLDLGERKESNCAGLISQAKASAGVKQSDIAPRRPAGH